MPSYFELPDDTGDVIALLTDPCTWLIAEVQEMLEASFRAVLFADPAMPDDLAQMYVELAGRNGRRAALLLLMDCREFAERAYLS